MGDVYKRKAGGMERWGIVGGSTRFSTRAVLCKGGEY